MQQDGALYHTDYEASELQDNTRKQHDHEKRNDFDTGLRTSAECLPSF